MKRPVQIILTMLVTALMSSSAFATISFSDDFESYPVNDGTNMGDLGGGWLLFVNVFGDSPNCSPYLYNYGVFAAPNRNDAISKITAGNTGNAFDVFSDYGNGDHANNNCIETNLFQERIVTADDIGSYTYRFDTQAPAALGTDVQAYGFIKLLDQNNFSTLFFELISTDAAGVKTLSIELDAAAEGRILQWGFANVASNYESSGRLYDNVTFAPTVILPPGPTPEYEGVPVPLWAYFLMGGLILLVGGLQLQARRKT
jgi:hypothetical protein